MRVLLTGATGFIGYEVARQLAEAGLQPRLAVRRPVRGTLLARLPAWMARVGAEILRPVMSLRRQPSLIAPGTVIGWNLNLEVERGCLWSELGIEPLYPTIATGIPAALDECVAFRWIHPVEDAVGW